jgi:hypothetical protein
MKIFNKTNSYILAGIILIPFAIYGAFWVAKHGSYWLFYEDMVQENIRELVKPEALK